MGAGALTPASSVQPEDSTSSSLSTVQPQASTSSTPRSSKNMPCAICSTSFTIFKRKKECYDCGRLLCSSCINKVPQRPANQRQCSHCKNLYSGNFTRSDLNLLQLKDLRHFLLRNNIPTHMCKEKQDLVELVLKRYGNEDYRQAQIAHQEYVNVLKERRHLEDSETPVVPTTDSTTQSETSSPQPTSDERRAESESENSQQVEEERLNVDQGSELVNDSLEDDQTSPSSQQVPVDSSTQPEPQLPGSVTVQEELEEGDSEQIDPKRRASIADLQTPDHVTNLSVRQLKEILARHFVDYKGCVERWELEDRVKRLWRETAENQTKAQVADSVGDDGDNMCRVCMDAVISCVLLECGHMVACTKCGKRLAECPICRQYVVRAVHVFRS